MASWLTGPLYALYTRRLRRRVAAGPVPAHVGLIMDGNRRWARQRGMASPSLGHRYGAEHVDDVLAWCRATGIEHVTVFVCSTENLQRRGDDEVAFLMEVIEEVVTERLAKGASHWRVQVAGNLDVLPDSTARALKQAVEATRDRTEGQLIGAGGSGLIGSSAQESARHRPQRGRAPRGTRGIDTAYWPAFREVDFLRALRSYGQRQRRYGV